MTSRTSARRSRSVLMHALATPVALLWLAPLWMMLVFSTLQEHEIFTADLHLLPSTHFMDNFAALQQSTDFLRTMVTSMVTAAIYTMLSVLMTSMAGWALVRYEFVAKRLVIAVILGTLTLPYFVVVIPQFIMVARDFRLSNTWIALIVPPLFNSLGVLFMRQSFSMMPADLFDAARVEGVKEWKIFLFVAMPLARPTLAALSIILFLHSWNNYLWPLLINSRPDMTTAPVALGSLIGAVKVSWGGIMTGATLLTAPMLVVFLFLQRHFIAGIAAGAVK